MSKIKLILDSGSDISVEEIEKLDVDLLSLLVTFGDTTYTDYVDIDGEKFKELINTTSDMPKTAMLSTEVIKDKFKKHLAEGNEILMVPLSSKGSGTFNSARIAKAELEEETGKELPISLIDSESFSLGILHPIYDAIDMIKEGKTREEIVAMLEESYKKQKLIFMMSDLSYLKRGGRIRATSAVIGSILGIIPILHINNGLVEAIGKERGKKRAMEALLKIMEKDCPSKKIKRVGILQRNNDDTSEAFKKLILERFEIEDFRPDAHPQATISTHAGSDFLAITYVAED